MRGLARRRPRASDTVVAICVEGLTYCLVFDAADLVGWWPADLSRAAVRLSVPAACLDDVAAGRTTGSAAVYSGRVTIDGDSAALARLALLADGSTFRSHVTRLAAPAEASLGAGPELVAVLGSPNDPAGALGRVALDRCAVAADLSKRSAATKLALCGGFGTHFNTSPVPHWRHCAGWLVRQHGVPPERIVGGVESRHTYEDVLLLRSLVDVLRPRRLTVVTSDYHEARARFVLELVLPGTAMVVLAHDGLSAGERDRLRRHDRHSLAYTVAAALLFGVDRMPGEVSVVAEGVTTIVRIGHGNETRGTTAPDMIGA